MPQCEFCPAVATHKTYYERTRSHVWICDACHFDPSRL